jgi:hypothetical protein
MIAKGFCCCCPACCRDGRRPPRPRQGPLLHLNLASRALAARAGVKESLPRTQLRRTKDSHTALSLKAKRD